MDIRNELIHGQGYAVVSIENIQVFKKLRDAFIEKIKLSNDSEKKIDFVRKKIAKMTKAEINKLMVDLIKFTNLSEMIINSCPKLIESLCGKKLFIQRRAHLIINVPGEEHFKILRHYETMSGVSPFTYIFWAPLHDLGDQGGVYCNDQRESFEIMKKEEAEGLVNGPTVFNMKQNQTPARLKFGQAIIFNPFVLHGNVIFKSNLARIACNTRFQSYDKPLLQKNSDYLKFHELT